MKTENPIYIYIIADSVQHDKYVHITKIQDKLHKLESKQHDSPHVIAKGTKCVHVSAKREQKHIS